MCALDSIFRENQEEALHKDGHQDWYRLVINDLGRNHSEAVIHTYESWSQPSEIPEKPFNGVRGEGDHEANRIRAARRAKRAIRFACKTAEFDRMITLTTKDNFTRQEMQRKVEHFIKLARAGTDGKIDYIVVPEKHDSENTSERKRGSHHVHIAVHGRQDYKLLVSIWHYRICSGRGFVHVSNPFNKRTGKAYSPAQMASYLYKYVSKNFSGVDFNKKSYWISQNIAPPIRTVRLFRTYYEALITAVEHFKERELSFGFENHRSWMDESLDIHWLAAGYGRWIPDVDKAAGSRVIQQWTQNSHRASLTA